jgi:hypothetical protein
MYDARAHAALGDVDATHRAADESIALAADPFATAGDVLFTAARELRTHGNVAAGAALLDRAVEWQRSQCADEKSFAALMTLARMLYEAGVLDEAAETLVELQRERPDDVDIIGGLGCIAARTRDVDAARSATSTLRSKTGRFHFGKHLMCRIAALSADEAGAATFLRGAFARGCSYDIDLHTDIDLALLSDSEWYRELLRPKG